VTKKRIEIPNLKIWDEISSPLRHLRDNLRKGRRGGEMRRWREQLQTIAEEESFLLR
jgi:hypothetical protein